MKRSTVRTAVAALIALVTWACSESPTSSIKTLEKIDVVIGTGAEALAGKTVTVHYSGWLYDETPPIITAASSTARWIAISRSRSRSAAT